MLMIKNFALAFLLLLKITFSFSQELEFTFNGFAGAQLVIDGRAHIDFNGLLSLTMDNLFQYKGHAFYPSSIPFGRANSSFSTTFVFAIIPEYHDLSSHGLAFFISPTENFSNALPSQYLGLLNIESNGNLTNNIFAIELDTIRNPEFNDINDNHVGIDINSLISSQSAPAGYYADDSGAFQNLSLSSGKAMQVWVEYENQKTQITVTISPIGKPKPRKPLLSYKLNLSAVLRESMYVGFSASTGSLHSSHYILGWSFKLNGTTPSIDLSKLPNLPSTTSKGLSKVLDIVIACASAAFLFIVVTFLFHYGPVRLQWNSRIEWN